MRRVLLALLLVPALAGCGERKEVVNPGAPEPDKVTLLLDFFANADHAPIYAAEAGGHFEELGLKVKIRQPTDPATPLKLLAAGKVDLAISYEPEVLRARDKGLRVVSVAALVQEPLTSLMWLPKAGITSPADLQGKRVGTAGIDYQHAYLQTILDRAGIDPESVDEKNVGFELNAALLSGRVDATLGGFWNYEGVQLEQRHENPQVVPVNEAGVPPYDELVIVANEDALERDAPVLRRFIGALARGNRDLRRDSKPALDSLLKANRELDRKLQRAVLGKTLPLFSPPRKRPYGWQEPRQWAHFAKWMRDHDLVKQPGLDHGAFDNSLLPGEGG
jgi:putative hydroxymethylpyrimidine transport system substrate-binding protein